MGFGGRETAAPLPASCPVSCPTIIKMAGRRGGFGDVGKNCYFCKLKNYIVSEMENKYKRTLITTALPYANGPVHIGHLAGVYVPADIYARYLRFGFPSTSAHARKA